LPPRIFENGCLVMLLSGWIGIIQTHTEPRITDSHTGLLSLEKTTVERQYELLPPQGVRAVLLPLTLRDFPSLQSKDLRCLHFE
jgi:hypothetical protein